MGQFSGKLVVEYIDGHLWKYRVDPEAPYSWTGRIGTVAPPDRMVTDFATIPRLLSIILPGAGWGRRGRWGPAAVLHDWLYLHQRHADGSPLRRSDADEVLHEAMRDLRVDPIRHFLIWSSVRCWGWVWWAWFRRKSQLEPHRLDAVMPDRCVFQGFLWGIRDLLRPVH